MARSLWEVFVSIFQRNREDEDGSENDESRFVPSPLDLSVRSSHGGNDAEIDRELNELNEKADKLEQARRER
jgi:hypothetical protein